MAWITSGRITRQYLGIVRDHGGLDCYYRSPPGCRGFWVRIAFTFFLEHGCAGRHLDDCADAGNKVVVNFAQTKLVF